MAKKLDATVSAVASLCDAVKAISDRIDSIATRADPRFQMDSFDIPYVSGGELEGIIDFLTVKYGGNPCDKGIIRASASSLLYRHYTKACGPTNALDLSNLTSYFEPEAGGCWMQVDFKYLRVRLTHYTIRSASGYIPNSWKLMGSNDGCDWNVIDTRSEIRLESWSCVTFPVDCGSSYKLLRLDFASQVRVSAFEVFGHVDPAIRAA